MAAVHLTTIPNTAHMVHRKLVSAKFFPLLTTLFVLGFKVLELFCAFSRAFLRFRELSITGKCTSRHLFACDGLRWNKTELKLRKVTKQKAKGIEFYKIIL